jgi:tRNA wybutosine-synthesizing protein 1
VCDFLGHLVSRLTYAKGVTYCGDSKAAKITMQHVPWFNEVCACPSSLPSFLCLLLCSQCVVQRYLTLCQVEEFVKKLSEMLPQYGLASEHAHSNCFLLAHRKVCSCESPLN